MKKLLLAACLLCGAAAFAQEIGTEIPATPEPATPAQPEAPAQPVSATVVVTQTVPGPHKGAFGIRANFTGTVVPAAPTSSSAPGAATPTLGLRYLASDALAFDFDAGLGLGLGNRTSFGFGVGLGLTAYLGNAQLPIRPFFTGAVTFGKALSPAWDDFVLGVNAGGGGEYWFNDHFSVDARLLVGMPLNLKNTDVISITTFQPGVGANFYF